MESEIKIKAAAKVVTIDIDGIIGVAEDQQFDTPDDRVATYERFESSLREIGAIKADRVVVNIRSTGGDVNDALLIYDALSALDTRVTTRCYGYVASAATVIAQAASKGEREISSSSLYLIHCCESACEGNSQSLSLAKELLEKSDSRIAEIYAEASGRDVEGFEELMNVNGGQGRWLTPKEAVAAGLADRIIAAAPISDDVAERAVREGLPPLPHRSRTARAIDRLQSALRLLRGNTDPTQSTVPIAADRAAEIAPSALPSKMAAARATATLLREDPPIGEMSRSANQNAYDSDAEMIKQQ